VTLASMAQTSTGKLAVTARLLGVGELAMPTVHVAELGDATQCEDYCRQLP
jgi:hypothetical protein